MQLVIKKKNVRTNLQGQNFSITASPKAFQILSDKTVGINTLIRLNKKYRIDFKRLKNAVNKFKENQKSKNYL